MVKRSKGKTTQAHDAPKSKADLAEKIIYFGKWKEGFDYMVNYLKTPMSSTLILRGNPGTGKRTLLAKALEHCDLEAIYLNPCHHHDDNMALRYLEKRLGYEVRNHASAAAKSKKPSKKTVVVLIHFEEFCRQRQMLLYQLTTLTQHGENFNFIGLTHDLDSMSGLEKRVRSRINAHSYNLSYPYSDLDEYIEFCSQLVGGHKFEGDVLEQLIWMYQTGNYELFEVKRFLISICEWDPDGNFEVYNQLGRAVYDPKSDWDFVIDRMLALTKHQLDLLKLIASYCHVYKTVEFTFEDLFRHADNRKFLNFQQNLELTMSNLEPLNLTFIQMCKADDILTPSTPFAMNIMPDQVRHAIDLAPELGDSLQTKSLWVELPSVISTDASTARKKKYGSKKVDKSSIAL